MDKTKTIIAQTVVLIFICNACLSDMPPAGAEPSAAATDRAVPTLSTAAEETQLPSPSPSADSTADIAASTSNVPTDKAEANASAYEEDVLTPDSRKTASPAESRNVRALARPNDGLFAAQRYLEQIHATEAWDVVKENRSITIAIVDTGVDLNHPDLKANLVGGVNLLDRSKAPQDDNGHGTKVAGVIAAVGNNGIGTTGLLWSAKVMPIKALDSTGFGDEDKLVEGIRYAVDHGAKIVVLSVGLYRYSQELRSAAEYAENKGVLLVAATGNDGKDLKQKMQIKYPAANPTVLAVGGLTANNEIEEESNGGSEIDIVAPWQVYTTAVGGGYKFEQGTSMAAPQVAAVAALILAKNPAMKPYQVRNLLRQTAEDVSTPGWDSRTGYGLLRADRALTVAPSDDIYEKNNSRDRAKPLPLGKMISAALAGGADPDWFYIDSPYDGTVQLSITTVDLPASIKLTHYAGNRAEGKTYANVQNKTTSIIMKKGKNYIHIQLADSKSKANIKYKLTPIFQIAPDPFEDNDKQYQAFQLPARSQKIKGTFHRDNDQDWYSITFDKKGTLRVMVDTDTVRIDPLIEIQGKGTKLTIIDNAREGEAEESDVIPVLPGKYYIRVANAIAQKPSAVNGEYSLTIDYLTQYTDPNEPNDRAYEAVTMSFGTEYAGVLNDADDRDWFKFTLAQPSYVRFNLSNIPYDRQMTLALYDKAQKPIATHKNVKTNTELQTAKVLKAGTYYVKMTADRPFERQLYGFTVTASPLAGGYTDINGHWAEKAITELSNRKIVTGYGDHTFEPDGGITRAEAVAMIVKAFNLPKGKNISYDDLNKQHWAYDAIMRASSEGIVQGDGDGGFAPSRLVTRVEMAVMIGNALHLKGDANGGAPFRDVAANHWAAPMLREMKAKDKIKGYEGDVFKPDKTASRAEFAYILLLVLNK